MFSSHPRAKFWSDKNVKGPEAYALNSHSKCWFDCAECGHCFVSTLNINSLNNWCTYCSNKKKLCDNNDCVTCFNKSFASVEFSKYWSDKNEMKPRQLLKNSHKIYLFDCKKCGHTFQSLLSQITKGNKCNYCANRVICKEDRCVTCYNKSFASVEYSKYWSETNELKPRDVFKNSAVKYLFNCDKCDNIFLIRVSHITSGVRCSKCSCKTEYKMTTILEKLYPSLITQYKVDWCKKIKHLPFDFVLEQVKIIIELDGEQHFKQVGKWKTPQVTRNNDIYKIKAANKNGFSIIRILQDDVHFNRFDWLKEIQDAIQKIVNEKKVQNIYICKKNEYDNFELGLE